MDNTKKIILKINYIISNDILEKRTYNRYFIIICIISNRQSKELDVRCKYISGVGHLKKTPSLGLLFFAENHSRSFDFICSNEKKMLDRIKRHINEYSLGYHDKVTYSYIRFL